MDYEGCGPGPDMIEDYGTPDRAALRKAKAEYARLYGPRPWWWWLAVGIVALLFGVEAWLVYRVVAGWPVADLFLLQRLAG